MKLLSIIAVVISLILSFLSFSAGMPSPPLVEKNTFLIGGFLPWWIDSSGLDTSSLSWISPFALTPQNGEWISLLKYDGFLPDDMIGVRMLWTVRIFHYDDGSFLEDPDETYAMVKKLKVFLQDSDGIVLDVEDYCLWPYIVNFTAAYRKLYPDKLLYLTLPDFRVSVDMTLVSDVDMFLLMAYDYSPENGILSPLTSVRETLNNYSFLYPKLMLGIPLYGYVFNTRGWVSVRGNSLMMASCQDAHEEDGETRCMVSGTLTTEGGELLHADGYPAVFLTDKQIKERISLAKKYHLSGVFFWALGYMPIP